MKLNTGWRVSALLTFAMMMLVPLLLAASVQAYESYEDYALRLIRKIPEDTRFRPDLESYLNKLATEARARRGRGEIDSHTLLRPAARAQALDMLLGDYLSHDSQAGHKFGLRFEAFAGPGDHGRHGENGARDRQKANVGKAKARAVFQQWMDSVGHRRNLMNRDYKFVSTGVVERGHYLYAVQIFWER